MKRILIEKIVVTVVLTAWWLWMPMIGYESNDFKDADIPRHVLYMLSHYNIWHLLGNLFVLWLMRNRLYLLPSLAIGFIVSLLPAYGWHPIGLTVGFSGVLFAIVGIKYGIIVRKAYAESKVKGQDKASDFILKALPFALAGAFVPGINWCIHLYGLLAGFVYGRYNRE